MNGRLHNLILTALVAATSAMLYSGWPSRSYSNDDLQYALIVTQATTGDRLYHPSGSWEYVPSRDFVMQGPPPQPNARYILEWPTSARVVRAWRALGWRGDVIDPILSIRAIAGAVGLTLFFAALRSATGRRSVALIGTGGLATTASYWTYSTHVDQSMVMTMWLAVALLVLVSERRPSSRSALKLIVALVLASFYNLTASITAAVFIAARTVRERRDGVASRGQFAGPALAYGLAVAVGITVTLTVHHRPIVDAGYWRGAMFAGKPEYGVAPIRDLARAAIGLGKSQVLYPGVTGSLQKYWDSVSFSGRAAFGVYYLAISTLMLATLALLAIERKRMSGERRWLAGVLLGWFAAYFAFNWLWDPGYNKYWLVPLVSWWACAALLTAHLLELRPRRGLVAAVVFATFAVVSGANNLLTQFLPESRPSHNPWEPIARSLEKSSPQDALFVSPDYHPLDFSIAFFGRRDVLSLGLLNRNAAGDPRQVAAIVADHARTHRASGGPIYVYGIEGLSQEQTTAFLALLGGGTLRPAWTFPDVRISELTR